jgi:ADP-heptose:LPS heptosyltransferase
VVLRAGLWCSPCGVFGACPRHTDPPECMALLDVEQVVQAARRLLAAQRPPAM